MLLRLSNDDASFDTYRYNYKTYILYARYKPIGEPLSNDSCYQAFQFDSYNLKMDSPETLVAHLDLEFYLVAHLEFYLA